MKGQISFDFLFAIIVFLIVIAFVFNFANDFEDKNENIINSVHNYDVYLQVDDYVKSTTGYNDYNVYLNPNYSGDCEIKSKNNTLYVGNEDKNYAISGFRKTADVGCDEIFKVK